MKNQRGRGGMRGGRRGRGGSRGRGGRGGGGGVGGGGGKMGGDNDDGEGYGEDMEVRVRIHETFCLFALVKVQEVICSSLVVFCVFAQLFKYISHGKIPVNERKLEPSISFYFY